MAVMLGVQPILLFIIFFMGVLIMIWLASLRSFELNKMMLEQLQKGVAISTKKKSLYKTVEKDRDKVGCSLKI